MNKKGFTLIELMIVVAIIAIIAAIAIPSLLNARRTSNENAALATVKSFGTAAVEFSNSNSGNNYWGNGTTDFTPTFSHVGTKAGYTFKYFSDAGAVGTNTATRFVYLAYPVSTSSGRKAYWLDESQAVFEATNLDTAAITALAAFTTPAFTTVEAGNAGLVTVGTWTRK